MVKRLRILIMQVLNFLQGRGYKTVTAECADDAVKKCEAVVEDVPVAKDTQESLPTASPRSKARDFLKENGIGEIRTQDDVNRIFWEMAARRLPVSKQMANAVRIVVCDNRLMKSFNRKLELYNRFVCDKSVDPDFKADRQKLKEMEKSHKAEVHRLTQSLRSAEKERNVLRQRLEQEEGADRKVARKLMNQLKSHQGRFIKAYDFTSEADVTEFLSWYRLLKRPVSKRTIHSIVAHLLSGSGGDVFLRMVEAHNLQFKTDADFEGEYE